MPALLEKIRDAYDKFQQVLTEGNYRSDPTTFWSLFTSPRKNMPETTETAFGSTMIDTSRSFGTRLLWASAIAIVSMDAMAWVAAGLAVAGVGMFALEFSQSLRTRKEIITERNFASQLVRGTRADLCRLHQAQVRIMNLAGAFQQASQESTSDTVRRIIKSVEAETARVEVLESGKYDAGLKAYEFSEPGLKLVHDKQGNTVDVATVGLSTNNTSALQDMKLRPAFDTARQTEAEIIDRLVALQQALPQDIFDKVEERLAAQKKLAAPVFATAANSN